MAQKQFFLPEFASNLTLPNSTIDYGMKSFKAGQEGVRVFSPENGIGVSLPRFNELDECDY